MFLNKVVLITGGSAGIGAVTAEQFAKEGAKVAIVGRNDAKLKEVVQRCMAYNPHAIAIKADLSKDEETNTVVKQTIDKFGKLDVLVNNAGILREANILVTNFLDVFDEVMNVNMRGPARITHQAVPHLIKSKGNIVNVSSVAGCSTSRPNYIAYRTSKAALNHFTRCCAYELAEYEIRVNAICPGPVLTGIFDGLSTGVEAIAEQTALRRASDPLEIANLILYMGSAKAKSITGSVYVIDNGILLK